MDNHKKRIVIDMDDVMANATGQFIRYYQKEFGVGISRAELEYKEEGHGYPAEHREVVSGFPFRPGFFRSMDVMDGCVEVVRELNHKYEVFIVSAAMEFPQSLIEKLEWLKEHFPFLHWKQITFCGSKNIVHGDFMIDDLSYNLEKFNGEKFIFSAPHNLQVNHYRRLNDWGHVGSTFL